MIIPFCMDSCYEGGPAPGPAVVIQQNTNVHQASNPVAFAVQPTMSPVPMQQYQVPQPPMMQPPVAQALPVLQAQPPVVQAQAQPAGVMEAAAAPQPQSLSDFLASINFVQYEPNLREMGATEPLDLLDVTEEEFTQVRAGDAARRLTSC